jgi:hypothetical protein
MSRFCADHTCPQMPTCGDGYSQWPFNLSGEGFTGRAKTLSTAGASRNHETCLDCGMLRPMDSIIAEAALLWENIQSWPTSWECQGRRKEVRARVSSEMDWDLEHHVIRIERGLELGPRDSHADETKPRSLIRPPRRTRLAFGALRRELSWCCCTILGGGVCG